MASLEQYLEKMQADISKALLLCADEAVRKELGARTDTIEQDLIVLSALKLEDIPSVKIKSYEYFRGPNPHDDFYDVASALLSLLLSIFSQLNGLAYQLAQEK